MQGVEDAAESQRRTAPFRQKHWAV